MSLAPLKHTSWEKYAGGRWVTCTQAQKDASIPHPYTTNQNRTNPLASSVLAEAKPRTNRKKEGLSFFPNTRRISTFFKTTEMILRYTAQYGLKAQTAESPPATSSTPKCSSDEKAFHHECVTRERGWRRFRPKNITTIFILANPTDRPQQKLERLDQLYRSSGKYVCQIVGENHPLLVRNFDANASKKTTQERPVDDARTSAQDNIDYCCLLPVSTKHL